MNEPITQHELEAYADGELSGERLAAVERALAGDPELARRAADLRALRRRVGDLLREGHGPSASLRNAVAAMPMGAASARDVGAVRGGRGRQAGSPRHRSSPFRWVTWGSAAAAVVVMGVVLSRNVLSPPPAQPPVQVVPASLVAAVTEQHVECSAIENHFLAAGFPKVRAELGPAVRGYLEHDAAVPDLVSRGYTFAGAGPCKIPGGKTLHLLFRSNSTGKVVSVFMQPDHGQVDIEPDRAAEAAGPGADHPMVVWRSEGVVYFLVGDSFGDVQAAAAEMGRRI